MWSSWVKERRKEREPSRTNLGFGSSSPRRMLSPETLTRSMSGGIVSGKYNPGKITKDSTKDMSKDTSRIMAGAATDSRKYSLRGSNKGENDGKDSQRANGKEKPRGIVRSSSEKTGKYDSPLTSRRLRGGIDHLDDSNDEKVAVTNDRQSPASPKADPIKRSRIGWTARVDRPYGSQHWSVSFAGTLITRRASNPNYLDNSWRKVTSEFDCDEECQVVIINEMRIPFTFCWVNDDGKLYHYYPINDGSIRDGSVSNAHTEFARVHHAFVGFKSGNSSASEKPTTLEDICSEDFLFIYRPNLGRRRHELQFYFTEANVPTVDDIEVDCDLHCIDLSNDKIIDNSAKVYDRIEICGFTVFFEPGVFEAVPGLRETLQEDFEWLCRLMPVEAVSKLRESTPLWVNQSLTFGMQSNPTVGRGSTFHPSGDWLRSNGLNTAKAGCVEMYSAKEHLQSRSLWGPGGVMVHEYSHAYHNKYTKDGYSNPSIQSAYELAMSRGLYDRVPVHGPQGVSGPQKAYACTNCMEFFAELSVAYHWVNDDTTEYNKWFPHNRAQLELHDPETFSLLERAWSAPDLE